ncbi:MAG: proline--tRNA ligase, partial [Rhizobiales bacterium]|nr:proline--tRNA ligase [Hyphomicrobiales bacterium]
INMKPGDTACDALSEKLQAAYEKAGHEVLYDDTDQRAGAKFATVDLIGIPWQVIVGPRGAADGTVEVKKRATGERDVKKVDELLSTLEKGA